jgi:hypothetical protein
VRIAGSLPDGHLHRQPRPLLQSLGDTRTSCPQSAARGDAAQLAFLRPRAAREKWPSSPAVPERPGRQGSGQSGEGANTGHRSLVTGHRIFSSRAACTGSSSVPRAWGRG